MGGCGERESLGRARAFWEADIAAWFPPFQGSPHRLVRINNNKSHQPALALRENDETLLATPNGLPYFT